MMTAVAYEPGRATPGDEVYESYFKEYDFKVFFDCLNLTSWALHLIVRCRCEHRQIKAVLCHLNRTVTVSFKIQSAGVHR